MNCICHFNHWGPVKSPAIQGRGRSGCRQRSLKIAGGFPWVGCGAAVILILCMLNLEKISSSRCIDIGRLAGLHTSVGTLKSPKSGNYVHRGYLYCECNRSWIYLGDYSNKLYTVELRILCRIEAYMNNMCHFNDWGPVSSPAMQGCWRSGCRQGSLKIAKELFFYILSTYHEMSELAFGTHSSIM